MAKAKKAKRRMRKAVRKTLGTLLLVTSLLVAAIPVENLQADTGIATIAANPVVATANEDFRVDASTDKVFASGDGRFKFAHILYGTSTKVGVLVDYTHVGALPGGKLEIPETMDAYTMYEAAYVAANADGDPLFYRTTIEENGVQSQRFLPCYYAEIENWQGMSTLYYQNGNGNSTSSGDASNYTEATGSKKRLTDVPIAYVGYQRVSAWKDAKSSYTIADVTKDTGIFANQTNITSLLVGANVMGIGDYAFYQCAGLNDVELSNGVVSIGNYAFAECQYLANVTIDVDAPIRVIGAHAFSNCQAMRTFKVPKSVNIICDSAFENCISLVSIDFSGQDDLGVPLKAIGSYVFRNCKLLQSVTFPKDYSQQGGNVEGTDYSGGTVDLSIFDGCKSLSFVCAKNPNLKFTGDLRAFQSLVAENGFYFEGVEGSEIHLLASGAYSDGYTYIDEAGKERRITFAFSYLDPIQLIPNNKYEKITYAGTAYGEDTREIYQVNSSNELINCEIPVDVTEIVLPEEIGPYAIATIGSNTFAKVRCTLETIYIPSSVTTIEMNAFKGCHELSTVVFSTPCNVQTIGTDAFKTQAATCSKDGHSHDNDNIVMLRFVGPMSDDCMPFVYATSKGNYFSNSDQYRTYIEYYSGWPQNLVVQYDAEAEKVALVNYPILNDYTTISSNGSWTTSLFTTDDGETEIDETSLNYVKYPCYPREYASKAMSAVTSYRAGNTLNDMEQTIVDAALDIEIPACVEMVKEGLFEAKEKAEITDVAVEKSISVYGLEEVAAETFKNAINLKNISFLGNTQVVGDHALEGCKNLEYVYFSGALSELQLAPFLNCENLEDVVFEGNNYECKDSIIFENISGGKKLVEYLEGRQINTVVSSEMEGVTAIAEEAFRDTNVSSVDLTTTTITVVPSYAFADTTPDLYSVYLPDTCVAINENAFLNSSAKLVQIPESVTVIHADAFKDVDLSKLVFQCVPGSVAESYAESYGISTRGLDETIYYYVTFWDEDGTLLKDKQRVLAGEDAVPPEDPTKDGYIFIGWNPDYRNVQRDIQATAQYKEDTLEEYTVTFYNWDDTVYMTQTVKEGQDAIPPQTPPAPTEEGYTFTFAGWRPAITNVTENIKTWAQFDKVANTGGTGDGTGDGSGTGDGTGNGSGTGDGTGNGSGTGDGTGNGNGSGSGSGDGSGNGSGSGSGDGSGSGSGDGTSTNKELYTLTVKNGSGSGSYAEGSQPIIIANDPPTGKVFDSWTIDPADVTIASKKLSATVITMPAGNVTVTANYKTSSGSTSSGNNTNTGTTNKPNGTGSNTVIIDKNGLSNTGVVNVTVNGSSDNFTVKINESASATEAIIKALKAEYGDISNIKYFPMDISLYDSTGKTKITDTKGLSISITLPLPDSLITYAGNNKVAGVVDEKLDKLKPRFTTIDGVSCITFTCEHFSPYVIYVETNNLSSGTVSDSTPKTGDGIHPKWFLSIGLALMAVVLFMKKDQQTAVRRVRA